MSLRYFSSVDEACFSFSEVSCRGRVEESKHGYFFLNCVFERFALQTKDTLSGKRFVLLETFDEIMFFFFFFGILLKPYYIIRCCLCVDRMGEKAARKGSILLLTRFEKSAFCVRA